MVLDPFSAASKPWIPPDSHQPKRPLPFAQTPEHFSTPALSVKLPKPRLNKEKDGFPTQYPEPPYSHSRTASAASITTVNQLGAGLDLLGFASPGGRVKDVGSDEWMTDKVAECVDAAKGDLTITGLGLTTLSTKISELRDLVTLPSGSSPKPRFSTGPLGAGPPRSPLANAGARYPGLSVSPGPSLPAANSRQFARSTSAPAYSGFFSSVHQQPRSNRTPSALGTLMQSPGSPTTTEASEEDEDARNGSMNMSPVARRALLASPSMPNPPSPSSLSPGAGEARKRSFGRSKTGAVALSQGKAMDIEIYAGQNQLRSLPSALFEISNLTVLSLRGNRLTALPAAIGELQHLKELNISLNQITELPSTILNLNLELFTASSNAFIQKEPEVERFSDLIRHHEPDQPVPRLTTICMNLLISPRPPNELPPLLDMYEWDAPVRGVPHPLLDPNELHEIIPSTSPKDLGRVLQVLRTASTHFQHKRRTGLGSSLLHSNIDPFPKSHRPPPPDDASTNPFFYSCPSPRHLERDTLSTVDDISSTMMPSRRVFLHPAEERIEWRGVCGTRDLPVRWMGCSPGCLDFLEHEDDEEDEWMIDTDVSEEETQP
ncbi:hypothetical protein I317_01329 [Kwoniella heveanensis CBS 569]|nr:hypothetical protein I317_01329 [Kwoniella heveanensis CBS 569]